MMKKIIIKKSNLNLFLYLQTINKIMRNSKKFSNDEKALEFKFFILLFSKKERKIKQKMKMKIE